MLLISIITFVLLGLSFLFDVQKTLKGIKKGLTMFMNLLPVLLLMLAFISIVLFLVPNELLIRYMGQDAGIEGWVMAALLGSVALIPGFIAYPLCGVLIKSGVAYTTIAVFITILTMVGLVTLPLEAKFFGWKTSIIRNLLSFIAAIFIGFIMSLFL
ncbi:MAG TPA: hypothetical protein DHV48_00450 [Prolixibacteraceae bacterium]|nr:hypothetical protein [Prolixibacteraceae bacterium]